MSNVLSVEEGEEYYHVRYRDPDGFADIRTPDWAALAAGSVSPGGEVRVGRREEDDDWRVQSVLIDADRTDKEGAEELANEIVEKIEA